MREIFVPDGSFTGSNVQLAVKGVIRGVLVSLSPSPCAILVEQPATADMSRLIMHDLCIGATGCGSPRHAHSAVIHESCSTIMAQILKL